VLTARVAVDFTNLASWVRSKKWREAPERIRALVRRIPDRFTLSLSFVEVPSRSIGSSEFAASHSRAQSIGQQRCHFMPASQCRFADRTLKIGQIYPLAAATSPSSGSRFF
jgi:hypothetical protein